jgi:hypothetical protein
VAGPYPGECQVEAALTSNQPALDGILKVISFASVEAASSLRVTLGDLDNLGPTNTDSIGNKL